MTTGNDAEPGRVFRRWLRSASAFDLYQNDLKTISPLRSGDRLAVILPNRNQVNYATRLTTIRAGESQEMPMRPRVVRDGAADRNLGHRDGPFCCASCDLEPSQILWITLFSCHQNYAFAVARGRVTVAIFLNATMTVSTPVPVLPETSLPNCGSGQFGFPSMEAEFSRKFKTSRARVLSSSVGVRLSVT